MSGGFSAGFLKGLVLAGLGAAAVSLALPLPPEDPGRKTQVDLSTPSGSGFNAGRTDTDPVLPDSEDTITKDSPNRPVVSDSAGQAPVNDTAPSEQPRAQTGGALPQVSTGQDDLALVSPGEDQAPIVSPPALGVPMPQIDNPVADLPPKQPSGMQQPEAGGDEAPLVVDGTATAGSAPTPEVQTEVETQDGSALMRNRAVFENPEGKPLFSIIIMDAGAEGLGQDVLATFSVPVTFALDPLAEGAAEKAKTLRRAGFEVLALAPAGEAALQASDDPAAVEAVVSGLFAQMPEAIGLIDRPDGAIQQDSRLTDQVVAALQPAGLGLVTYDIGLNAADQKARKADLRSGVVFRVLDQDRERSETIKRYLDRAALEAGKDGHVIVLGHSYADTVTALFSWALSARTTTLALAPASAVLLAR